MKERQAEKLFRGVTGVGDDLIAEAGVVQLPKRKKLSVWRAGVIAACLCLALVGTALAASPGLRETLAAVLGGFAPYAREQGGETYVVNEFEYKVLSAMTDGTTLRVYVQQRDLVEGRSSTDEFDGVVFTSSLQGGFSDCHCVDRDESTGTSLWCISIWGQIDRGTDSAALLVFGFTQASRPKEDAAGEMIPLALELVPGMIIAEDVQVSAFPFRVETIELSPLGLNVMDATGTQNDVFDMDLSESIRVCLADGTEIRAEREAASGQGSWEDADGQRKVLVWNFRDAVDLEQVAGVYVGDDYFPVK